MDDYDLDRFVDAQNSGGTYQRALTELQQGRKVSHWMWFVFPQLAGLGRSATAQRYAIRSLAEARAYVNHPSLGPRLLECSRAVANVEGRSAEQILGGIDAQKLRSSMTLFRRATPQLAIFQSVLDAYFSGQLDPMTLHLIPGE